MVPQGEHLGKYLALVVGPVALYVSWAFLTPECVLAEKRGKKGKSDMDARRHSAS